MFVLESPTELSERGKRRERESVAKKRERAKQGDLDTTDSIVRLIDENGRSENNNESVRGQSEEKDGR